MNNINKIYIKLASPKYILKQSYGEVLSPETINYKTKKPEINGLFCEKIFGPIKNYECSCGKYKNKLYNGIICDICGIKITKKNVRRKRMGHIKLCVPIVHIWYFRCLPNKISYLLNKSSKDIESIIYYEKYIVIKIKNLKFKKQNGHYLNKLDLINEEEYLNIKKYIYKNKNKKNIKFIATTGGEAIYKLLKNINITKLFTNFKNNFEKEKNNIKKIKLLKKLKIIELFHKGKNKNKPHYMIIKILPVIPPDLRPIITLDEGKYASSDLNEFYRKIIIRNNRLKKLISINAPNVILKNEKRILQESIDSLLDNSRKLFAVKSDSNRILKSLSDILKGKQGRFRQNLLGKRVDYSARSVIIVDPKLKLYECGLPKIIALELYKPFLINKLINKGFSINFANQIIKNKNSFIWQYLKQIIKGHPILLNRAPTLHRLSIQAFQPILINGKAIKLHPLVCGAFNADFDGDQMAIHLPLSTESIIEAKLLMGSPINIINIANGSPIIIPSQEILLGLYYLTKKIKSNKKKLKLFSSYKEIIIAHNLKILNIHDNIKFKYNNEFIITTVGRIIFNQLIPNKKKVGFINLLIDNKNIKILIKKVLYYNNIFITSNFLEKLKKIGLKYSFYSGTSFNLNDIRPPKDKKQIIYNTIKNINDIIKHYNMGLISNNEKDNKIIDEWSNTNSKITNKVINNIKNKKNGLNNLYMMLDSGARSSIEQIRQLSGMRGLMTKPQKYNLDYTKIIDFPIISNFYEGLSILEYFISTHGSRKGLADTALKTADAGYLTRRLVDVVQDVIIKEKDCNTFNGINIYNYNNKITENEILGKVVIYNISFNNKIIIKKGELIDYNNFNTIKKYKIKYITVRSPFTCESKFGICSKCYGSNLSNGKLINIGETVGVIAAQSIGEPGTQLTLRTFHVGGSTSYIAKKTKLKSKYKGRILLNSLKYIKKNNKYIVISRYTNIKIIDIKNNNILYNSYIPYGCTLYIKNNDIVNIGDKIYEINPYYSIVVSEYNGIVKYKNISYKSKNSEKFIIKSKNRNPTLLILDNNGKLLKNYNLSIGSYLNVKNNEKIKKGKILIKIPRLNNNYKDITGGLPKLSEIFEARNPINKSIISEIDGIVSNIVYKKNYVKIYITNNLKKKIIYVIKNNKQIIVQKNDIIKHGDKLTEGIKNFNDILNINGLNKIQNYLINNLQNIYKSQGVQINNKHFEIIINQMLKKVIIIDGGDTNLIKGNIINKEDFLKINKKIKNMVIITKSNNKKYYIGKIINKNKIDLYNEYLKFNNLKLIITKKLLPAIGKPILLGITKSSLLTNSFISSASFQETTKILSEAAISAKYDNLKGLKENIIIGNQIPAGTGYYYNKIKK
ncbi:DNA-directed RNA polymerase subunit beta' [Candidatus Shikimatogenerans bostrichidophilus]|uniref:DNA-directed RNA polymerase subunit beta' n=1 Tax=Candidatus Shikimatogenerans bostrichidophilus TaxID=2943807 RepID=UPI002965ECD1